MFDAAGRQHGLSQQQVQLVCTVLVQGPIGMSDLGRRLHIEKSNLSNVVHRLEQRGIVERTRDSRDRRATRVELTPDGARLAAATYGEVAAKTAELVHALTPADQIHLTIVIRGLLAD